MMRDLVISKLKQFIADSYGYGIPREFNGDDEDTIKDPTELDSMSDEQLLEAFESCVGFGG
jgi:hypothetical protein